MAVADILKYATLAYVVALAVWYGTATPKFDKSSKARPLLFVTVGLSLLVGLTTVIFTISADVPLVRIIVTLAMASFSAVMFKWALGAIHKRNLGLAFSGIVPGEVVQHGPYRFIRHPLYTGYSIFWASCVVISGSLVVAVLVAGIICLYLFAAKSEERDLMNSSLATAYGTYRKHTGLMLPRLFR